MDISSPSSVKALTILDRQHHLHPLTHPGTLSDRGPEMIVRAEGIYLYTGEGRRIIDASSALGNMSIGYGNPRLCEVAFKTMKELSFYHIAFGRSNPWAAALTAKLAEVTPANFQRFFLASTGSEAVESAVKIALWYWRMRGESKRRLVISRRMSYHGATLFAASLTGMDSFQAPFGLPLENIVCHADSPYWYRDGKGRSKEEFGRDVARALEKQILEIGPENVAAFVGDPIQTGGGGIIPPGTYWPEVRRICDRYGILLIADEVFTGFGKTGTWFAFQSFSFEPDLIVMAKGISGGYFPVSAVALGGKIDAVVQSASEALAHVFTNCGHPVGAAVALETITLLQEEKLVEKVRNEIGPYFAQKLNRLSELPFVGEVRSMGVLGAMDLDLPQGEKAAVLSRLADITWKKGLATRGNGLCLPMTISREQIDEVIELWGESIVQAIG